MTRPCNGNCRPSRRHAQNPTDSPLSRGSRLTGSRTCFPRVTTRLVADHAHRLLVLLAVWAGATSTSVQAQPDQSLEVALSEAAAAGRGFAIVDRQLDAACSLGATVYCLQSLGAVVDDVAVADVFVDMSSGPVPRFVVGLRGRLEGVSVRVWARRSGRLFLATPTPHWEPTHLTERFQRQGLTSFSFDVSDQDLDWSQEYLLIELRRDERLLGFFDRFIASEAATYRAAFATWSLVEAFLSSQRQPFAASGLGFFDERTQAQTESARQQLNEVMATWEWLPALELDRSTRQRNGIITYSVRFREPLNFLVRAGTQHVRLRTMRCLVTVLPDDGLFEVVSVVVQGPTRERVRLR